MCSTSTIRRPMCSCRARWSSPWRKPNRACAGTRPRAAAPSRRCSRRARGSTFRCSSTSATRCGSTRARANTCHVRRTEQRRAAVWALYQSDLLNRPLEETLPRDTHVFPRALGQLLRDHQSDLEEVIDDHATGWSLERIAPVERSILRVGLAEMLHG